jgi:hypothetical protein
MPVSQPDKTDPNQIRSRPIQNRRLRPELLNPIKAVYRLIGRYLGQTLEEFEVGFLQDAHADHEVAIWCRIATVWYDYHETFLNCELLSDNEERKLIAALIAISTGEQDVDKMHVPVTVGRRLLACYDGGAGA